jgi:NAD(P)-dependent dehydrogenase (short-subunit alcohol dehydrogenase family)
MVRQFRAAGARLIVTDVDETALDSAKAEAGSDLLGALTIDLATDAGCDAVAELCRSLGGAPDILVNNAGVGFAGRIDHVPREQWELLMQLNLLAPMRLCNHFVPQMVERGSGHIVNISSLAGWVGSHGMSAYCASKFGLRGFGVALAADLEDTGVHVTNVYPCFSRTPILDSPRYGFEDPMEVPARLISEPEDVVAEVVKGVQANRLHVFPDKHARRVHLLTRFFPWSIPMLNRRLRERAIAAAKRSG